MTRKAFSTDRATLWHGDCAHIASVIAPESIDAIVTDPPAGISFMGKAWDDDKGGRDQWVAWLRDVMRTALGLLKPGGHALVWALPRTSHWTATAIEDAGFEIRDVVVHICGTGFPKSLDVFKAIGERCTCGAYDETKPGVRDLRRDVSAQEQHRAIEGEALQSEVLRGMAPSHAARADGVDRAARKKRMDGGEPSVLPELDERREKSSVEGRGNAQAAEGQLLGSPLRAVSGRVPRDGEGGRLHHGAPARDGADDRSAADEGGSGASPRPQPVEQHARKLATLLDQRGAQACGACRDALRFAGYGTALKPASEHWILARKPLAGTVAENAIAYGTGGLRIDDCRIAAPDARNAFSENAQSRHVGVYNAGRISNPEPRVTSAVSVGRFPANVTLDEEAAALLDEQSGSLQSGGRPGVSYDTGYVTNEEWGTIGTGGSARCIADTGGASRFFYVAKATRAEKDAGLDHLPLRTGGDATDREEGSAGLNSPRAGSGRMGGVRNHHPTVKSIALMRWLCRLITPPGGIVLDLFAGSGTTGLAALAEGLRFVGVEREAEFVDVAAGRLAHVECVPVPELTQDGAPKAAPAQPSLFDAIGGAR